MWKKIVGLIDEEWLEKHFLFVLWLGTGIVLGLVAFFNVDVGTLFWFAVAMWIGESVALIVLLYKWITDLVEWKTTMEKKVDAILQKLN